MWHSEREEWVSLAAHPAARQALESIGSYLPAPDGLEPAEPDEVLPVEVPPAQEEPVAEAAPEPEVAAAPEVEPVLEVEPAPEPAEPDPLDSLLAPAHEFIPPPSEPPVAPEPAALTTVPAVPPPRPEPPARASRLDITPPPRQQDRRTHESSPPVERRRSVATPPPIPEPTPEPKRSFKLPSRWILIGSGVAALIAAGYFVKSRGGSNPKVPAQTVAAVPNRPPAAAPPATESVPAEVLPTLASDSADTTPQVGSLELQGVPGGGPESDLETRLRLADAIMWNPSQDFGSPESVLRARRKVDAVLNSIQAYRVDMRRLADSAGASRLGDRLEPFDEASRIDDVIHAMGDAISVLEDVTGRFAVQGGTLEFDRADDARRYNQLRDRADSLLRAPVEMDPHPVVRPPRRLVTRLLSTLPGGMARGVSGP